MKSFQTMSTEKQQQKYITIIALNCSVWLFILYFQHPCMSYYFCFSTACSCCPLCSSVLWARHIKINLHNQQTRADVQKCHEVQCTIVSVTQQGRFFLSIHRSMLFHLVLLLQKEFFFHHDAVSRSRHWGATEYWHSSATHTGEGLVCPLCWWLTLWWWVTGRGGGRGMGHRDKERGEGPWKWARQWGLGGWWR